MKFGPHNVIIKKVSCLHYCWVKTRNRMLRRARIGIYQGMPEWFESNYDKIELAEGAEIQYLNKTFILNEYKGPHPSVLDNHPWRHIDDIRKIAT